MTDLNPKLDELAAKADANDRCIIVDLQLGERYTFLDWRGELVSFTAQIGAIDVTRTVMHRRAIRSAT